MIFSNNGHPKGTCAVYHWWHEEGDKEKVYTNVRSPVLLSIATLRAYSDVPIVVLDISGSDHHRCWGHFPEKLNFRVEQVDPIMKKYAGSVPGWRHLSRFFDVHHQLPQYVSDLRTTMYVDSDIFWLKSPFPFAHNPSRMCISPWNTGYFYYNPDDAGLFFEVFDAFVKSAIHSTDFRRFLKTFIAYDSWFGVGDEETISYMAKARPELFHFLTHEEHGTIKTLKATKVERMKMLHGNGLLMKNSGTNNPGEREHSRGLACLVFKELYTALLKVFDDEDFSLVFDQQQLDYCLPNQFSLITEAERILGTEDEYKNYHLDRCLPTP